MKIFRRFNRTPIHLYQLKRYFFFEQDGCYKTDVGRCWSSIELENHADSLKLSSAVDGGGGEIDYSILVWKEKVNCFPWMGLYSSSTRSLFETSWLTRDHENGDHNRSIYLIIKPPSVWSETSTGGGMCVCLRFSIATSSDFVTFLLIVEFFCPFNY